MPMANQKQVGGTHYKADYQHWDLAIILSMGYLEGCSTKYVTRWRKAEGMMDLQKGQHYLEKLMEAYEIYDVSTNRPHPDRIQEEIDKFSKANSLLPDEQNYVHLLAAFETKDDLKKAMQILHRIIAMAEAQELARWRNEEPTIAGTPEDGGHHARQSLDNG